MSRHLFALSCLISGLLLWGLIPSTIFGDPITLNTEEEAICREIKKLISSTDSEKFMCWGEMICGISVIPSFYSQRNFRPAWVSIDGSLPHAEDLMTAIKGALMEGLNPDDYHLKVIRRFLSGHSESNKTDSISMDKTPKTLAQIDLLFTDAFLMYASHLLAGRVNPDGIMGPRTIEALNTSVTDRLRQIEINMERTPLTKFVADYSIFGRAGEIMSQILDAMEL